MFSTSCSTDEAPSRTECTLSFFKHQANKTYEFKYLSEFPIISKNSTDC